MKRSIPLSLAALLLIGTTVSSLAQANSPPTTKATSKASGHTKSTPAPLDPQIAIQMADDYFNSAQVMTADFVQIGVDGRRSEGKLYVAKPGRLRFEYALPATMEIIADGSTVAIRNRKLRTQQLYFISQTPLKFLLKRKIDLKRDLKVLNVTSDANTTTITVEDSTTFGGTSKIELVFDNKSFSLKQWDVTDPQGYQTLVMLHNIDLTTVPNPKLFHIPSDTFWP